MYHSEQRLGGAMLRGPERTESQPMNQTAKEGAIPAAVARTHAQAEILYRRLLGLRERLEVGGVLRLQPAPGAKADGGTGAAVPLADTLNNLAMGIGAADEIVADIMDRLEV